MHGHTLGVSRGRSDFVPRSRAERCWIDGDLIRLGAWPVGGIRPGGRSGPIPWLIDLSVLETAMRSVYGDRFRLGPRAPLLQMAANLLAEGDRRNAEAFAAKVFFPLPDYPGRFHDACAKHLAWGPAHRPGNPPIDVAAWVERAVALEQKFDPNQPRVPRGHPDGGQWTDGGNLAGLYADASHDENEGDRLLTVDEEQELSRLIEKSRVIRSELGDRQALLVLASSPDLPPPKTALARLWVLSHVIGELLKYAVYNKNDIGWISEYITELSDHVPEILGFIDPPREFMELVATTEYIEFPDHKSFYDKFGSVGPLYEWHHIVGQKTGFLPEQIYNTDNVIRISKGKHWAVSGEMDRNRPELGGISYRTWLKDKPIEEHIKIGFKFLYDMKVLKK